MMWRIPRLLASAHRLFLSHLSGVSFLYEVLHKLSILSVKALITLEFFFLKTVVLLLSSACYLAAKGYTLP